MNLRGQVISVIDLEKRFNLVRDNTSIRPKHIIVADFLQGSFGIIVDEVIEVIRVSESRIQLAPETVSAKIGQQYIKGVIVLEETEEKKARVHPIYLHEKEEKGKVEAKDENIASHERVLLLLDIKLILSEDEKKALTQNS